MGQICQEEHRADEGPHAAQRGQATKSRLRARDVKPRCPNAFTPESEALAQGCWPEPGVPQMVNRNELGNLKLAADEERALVAFMRTLSDGFGSAAR